MAQLALGLAGAVVGSFFGSPQLGFMAGSLVGAYLFAPSAPDQFTEGPRIGDLSVVGSSYGTSIPLGVGTARIGGNIIWSPGIKETKTVTETEIEGGKGGGSSTQTTVSYTYSASFAVAFCAGPIQQLLRIWADGKCIYDPTGTEEVIGIPNLRYQFHPGDENQLPDATIEATEGVGQVPAHRGLCYIVFTNLPLANFGNRVPAISAEVTTGAARQFPYVRSPNFPAVYQGDSNTSNYPFLGAIDVDRNRLYLTAPANTFYGADVAKAALYVLEADTLSIIQTINLMELADLNVSDYKQISEAMVINSHGEVLAITIALQTAGVLSFPTYLLLVNKDSLSLISMYYEDSTSRDSLRQVLSPLKAVLKGYNTPPVYFTCNVNQVRVWGIPSISNPTAPPDQWITVPYTDWAGWWLPSPIQESSTRTTITLKSSWGAMNPQVLIATSAQITGGGSHPKALFLQLGELTSTPSESILGGSAGTSWALEVSGTPRSWLYRSEDLGLGADKTMLEALAYFDEADGNYLILGGYATDTTPEGGYAVKWNPDTGIIWAKSLSKDLRPFVNRNVGSWSTQRVSGYLYYQVWGNGLARIDCQTGDAVAILVGSGLDAGFGSYLINHTVDGKALAWSVNSNGDGAGNPYIKFYLERWAQANPVPVAPFIEKVLSLVGMSSDLYDVSALAQDTTLGYYVSRTTSAKSLLAPLASALKFDAVESDYKIVFKHRGQAPVATILQDDLQPVNSGGDVLEETITQEVELPSRITVKYLDPALGYNSGSQAIARPSNPNKSMFSNSKVEVETAVVMTATQARQLAETTLYTAWQERAGYKLRPHPKYAYLDPTDVIALLLNDGTVFQQRLLRSVMGADLTLELEAVGEDGATYSSTVIGDPGKLPLYPIATVSAAELLMLDLPYLLDTQASRNVPILIGVVGGYGRPNWDGAAVYKQSSDSTYAPQFSTANQASNGFCTNALPPTDNPWVTDETTTLTVSVSWGGEWLATVTQDQMLNFANPAAVQSGSSWEIIQFRDVTQIDASTYELHGLLRGRRGTDVFTDGHQPGDRIIFLRASEMSIAGISLAELNAPVLWKAVPSGTYPEQATPVPVTATGNNLKPYAPVHVKITPNGTAYDISWVRRTRFSGNLLDTTGDVPLNETFERYQLDILNATTGAIVRTIEVTDSTTTTYVDEVSDGVEANWKVIVYQMSELIGRGFPSPAVATIPKVEVSKVVALAIMKPMPQMEVNELTTFAVSNGGIVDMQVNKLSALAAFRPGPTNVQVSMLTAAAVFSPVTSLLDRFRAGQTTFQSSSTTITSQLPDLNGVDLTSSTMLCCVMHRSALTPPAGWTLIKKADTTTGSVAQSVSVYSKDAVSSADSLANVVWTQASAGRMVAISLVLIAEASGHTYVAAESPTASGAPSPFTIPAVTAVSNHELGLSVVSAAIFGGGDSIPPEGSLLLTPVNVADDRLGVAIKSIDNGRSFSGVFQIGSTASTDYCGITIRFAQN